MMRTLIYSALVAAQLAGAVALAAPALTPPANLDGLSFGQSARQIGSLVPVERVPEGCARERLYVQAGAIRPAELSGVSLDRPGLVYRFVDDSLYAVEAEFPPGHGAFARLRHQLARRYGTPSVTESWVNAPTDTYVYRHRMNMAGWYGIEGSRSIWLTSADDGGRIVMTDNAVAGWAMQRIGEQCIDDRGGVDATADSSHPGRPGSDGFKPAASIPKFQP